MVREGKRKREIVHVLIHTSDGCNGQGYPRAISSPELYSDLPSGERAYRGRTQMEQIELLKDKVR